MRVLLTHLLFLTLLGISLALPYAPLNHRHHRRNGNDITTYETVIKRVHLTVNANGTYPVTSYQTTPSSSTISSSFATTPFFKMNATTSAPWNNDTISATSTSAAPNVALDKNISTPVASSSAEAAPTSSANPQATSVQAAPTSSAVPQATSAQAAPASSSSSSTPVISSDAPLPSSSINVPVGNAAMANTFSSSSPASSSSPTSASSSASATPSGQKSSKRGLAWIGGTDPSVADMFKGVASWYYNWGSQASNLDPSFEFVQSQHSADGIQSASSAYTNGATVFGFNEPDLSNMDAGQAASLYKQYLTPLRQSGSIKSLGSPAISNVGENWLNQFMQSCSDCNIDFIVAHWYGTGADQLKGLVNSLSSTYNKPIWVSEFACTNWDVSQLPSLDDVYKVFEETIEFLESNDAVERYAWFAPAANLGSSVGENNALVTAAGKLSGLGSKYLGI
ncbi:cell wall protein Asl1, predicted O-glucosyl hydrolase [Schizosaccharomyces osmophilus]|uniref:Cell wall protein Asl1, predicted O-glucosyl hydrolase n=1 Tax=Schizosaccharomyces osmophilus TaxID=2545709 RepID=A0AAE9WCZ9_9SCHI|nr:cell wall protein Asl1, predicted O-glucosyl hydrolase [Schizosaccharomyces osmophilus]WBW74152.1 cell wall protein Asl1, predicted O-glucosyl hydrolase [Schizosaccharomyces osmophilus]